MRDSLLGFCQPCGDGLAHPVERDFLEFAVAVELSDLIGVRAARQRRRRLRVGRGLVFAFRLDGLRILHIRLHDSPMRARPLERG